jgi:hypothetical protein
MSAKRIRSQERKKLGLGLVSVELEQNSREAIASIPIHDLLKFVSKSTDVESMRMGSLSAKCRIIIGNWLEKHGYLKDGR